MTSLPVPRKPALNSGWILVTGLLSLCVLGTWMTARNYRSQVFTSTSATVLENQWPESRISAVFSPSEIRRLRPGMVARITLRNDRTLLSGRVLTTGIQPDGSSTNAIALIAVTETSDRAQAGAETHRRLLAPGTPCSVTIDTTIPVDARTDTPSSPR